jgi:hypothetical protein
MLPSCGPVKADGRAVAAGADRFRAVALAARGNNRPVGQLAQELAAGAFCWMGLRVGSAASRLGPSHGVFN